MNLTDEEKDVSRKMKEMKLPGDRTLTLNLSPAQAEALERLCHRLEARCLAGIAEGTGEAMQMLAGLNKLADALAEAAFFSGRE